MGRKEREEGGTYGGKVSQSEGRNNVEIMGWHPKFVDKVQDRQCGRGTYMALILFVIKQTPRTTQISSPYSTRGIFKASVVHFFAFVGFDAVVSRDHGIGGGDEESCSRHPHRVFGGNHVDHHPHLSAKTPLSPSC
ncbi:hypothetical protein ACLOJK_029985 [Asimina triloba]